MKSSLCLLNPLLLALIAATALSCSGARTDGQGTTPESGGAPPPAGATTTPTPAEVCEVVAGGMCTAINQCCPGLEGAIPPERCSELVDRCVADFEGSASLREGRVRIDEDGLRQIREAFASCAPLVDEDLMPSPLVGTVSAGGPCGASGDPLASDVCAPGLYCDSEAQVCQPLMAENQPCPSEHHCAPGLVCRINHQAEGGPKEEQALGALPDPFFCLPPVPLGGQCDASNQCAQGICVGNQCIEGQASPFYCPGHP